MTARGPAWLALQVLARGLLLGGLSWWAFGPLAALLAGGTGAGLVPLEAWARRRRRWSVRCGAVLLAWPLAALLTLALFFQGVYAAHTWRAGRQVAWQDLSEAVTQLPRDPTGVALRPYLRALPWHTTPRFTSTSTTLAGTAALLATVLTLVTFCGVFLGAPPSATAYEEVAGHALQTVACGVCSVVIGLAWWAAFPVPVVHQASTLAINAIGSWQQTPPAPADPVGLWGLALVVGPLCPLAAALADALAGWLSESPRPAPPAPAPRRARRGAARAAA